MNRLKSVIAWIGNNAERVATFLAILSAIGAALGWLIDSYIKREEERVTRSLEYVNKFQSPEISGSYDRLFTVLEDSYTKMYQAKGSEINEIIRTAVSDHKAEPDVRRLSNFYSLVSMCGVNQICDRDTLCSVFYKDIDAFGRDFYVIFDKYKRQWGEDFNKGLGEFRAYCKNGIWPWSKDFSVTN